MMDFDGIRSFLSFVEGTRPDGSLRELGLNPMWL